MAVFGVAVLLVSYLMSIAVSDPLLHLKLHDRPAVDLASVSGLITDTRDELFCESWHLSVETNNAGSWAKIPVQCLRYVMDYCTGDRYASYSEIVADDAYRFATGVDIVGDGKDVWVFDIDETLLSNLPYYALHEFGLEEFNEAKFDEWINLARAPPLPATLKLYNKLYRLGFEFIFLTGRVEDQRGPTIENLIFAGYHTWKRLILRDTSDEGLPAIVYKSKKRMELIANGFWIHGNSGDQWSDLLGEGMAKRCFKLPNPMYYID